jgi:Tfp pilus assembly protein PilF
MTSSQVMQWLFCFLFASFTIGAWAADSCAISGVVRDEKGNGLTGVTITLARQGGTASVASQTISGVSGEYHFAGLPLGDYTLTAALTGFAASPIHQVLAGAKSCVTTIDISVARSAESSDRQAGGTPHPPLEFQTAGIRGVIDPGGYSASTSQAATGLLAGIADTRRTDSSDGESSAAEWPCALEPELRKAVAEHPDQIEANRRLGQFLAAHDEPASAIPVLEHALEVVPGDYLASRALASAWIENRDFESARTILTGISQAHPDPQVHRLLARADEGLGLFQMAAQQYRLADSLEPSEQNLFGVGYELILAGSLADGVKEFEAAVRRYPRSISLRIGLGTAQFLQGQSSEALQSFVDATDINPADPRPYPFLAKVSVSSNSAQERVSTSFERFLEQQPDRADANYFYALELSRGNDVDMNRVQALLKRAIQLDSTFAEPHLQLADIYVQLGDYANAVTEYETTIRFAPGLDEAHYRLALTYKRLGRSDRAAQEMQIFLSSKRSQPPPGVNGDLSQFISVMGSPAEHTGNNLQCPVASH